MRAEYAWLLAAIPAGMFFVLAPFGRYLPRKGDYLGVLAIGTSFVLFFFVLYNFLHRGEAAWPITSDIKWSDIGGFHLRMGIYVDQMTILMLGVVTSVSVMVNIFS